MLIDGLIDKIKETENPACIGLDTDFSYLPDAARAKCKTVKDVCKAILAFNRAVIDAVADIAPAVKVQIAYYEIWGADGIAAFSDTLKYAKAKGMFTVADAKRNDIGSTAAAYAKAYLGVNEVTGKPNYECDFLTVNPYLGSEGLVPFVNECKAHDKGIFVLVKTSNPSSGELQDLHTEDGGAVYERAAVLTRTLGADTVGKHGYSAVGAVVGATYPAQAAKLRRELPHTFFLVPGYGAQGGGAKDAAAAFDKDGRGALVNNSRGILLAYRKNGGTPEKAARDAVLAMRDDLARVKDYL